MTKWYHESSGKYFSTYGHLKGSKIDISSGNVIGNRRIYSPKWNVELERKNRVVVKKILPTREKAKMFALSLMKKYPKG